jgi:glycosyltransferase involved in cell wall biosynthesis
MLLSIIIPSFQQGDLLRNALKSIESQTFEDYEVLIMDAESKDSTAQVIAEFSHLPLFFYSGKDKGIYDAMNKGIDISKGQYLYFMGCDDWLASDSVLQDVFSIPSITQNEVIYGDVIFTGTGVRHDGEFTYFKLYIYNICHQSIFVHRSVFEKLGKFDIRYKVFADWEFNMRWFDTPSIKRQYVPIIVAYFNTTGLSSGFQDDVFFAEQASIKQKHFPKIVRYLAVNQHRFIQRTLTKALTFKRITFLNFIRDFLE